MSPIDKAIEYFGTQQALADAIGATQPQVSHWKLGIKPVPPRRAIRIEKETKGVVKAADLLPEIFGTDAA